MLAVFNANRGARNARAALYSLILLVVLAAIYGRKTPLSQDLALGSAQQCAAYSGLPIDWQKNAHAGMAYVPAGQFTLGTTLGYAEERAEISIQAQPFWIDQTEVTVAQFAAFVAASSYVTEAEREGGGVVFVPPSAAELQQRDYAWWRYIKGANWQHPAGVDSHAAANQPVTLITLTDALAYARWLGRDLPTEIEWEYAAKAGRSGAELEKEPRTADGKPAANFWQGKFPLQNSLEDGYQGLAPVGCFAANAFDLFDMLGNAWEQTKDVYTANHQLPAQITSVSNSPTQPQNLAMVVKGGSHLCGRDFCVRYRASAREAHEANLPISHIGFRTVLRDQQQLPEISAW